MADQTPPSVAAGGGGAPSEVKLEAPAVVATPTGPTKDKDYTFQPPQIADRHVKYVLMAEFDIDKGSVLKYQYPRPTGLPEGHLAELMLPEGVHLRETDFTVFFIKTALLQQSASSESVAADHDEDTDGYVTEDDAEVDEEERKERGGLLCCLNVVRTKMDASVRRGAVVKALTICSPHRFFSVFKPILLLALDSFFSSRDPKVLEDVFHRLNELDISSVPRLSDIEMRVLRASRLRIMNEAGPDTNKFVSGIKWQQATIPIRVPLHMEEDETAEASIVGLVRLFKEATMTIFASLFMEKRVLFLGHNQPARDVCNAVLSACLLISPPVTGTLRRAYPYANLTNLEFLEVPGYIAGVTNPIFEQRHQWWDVLCNIETGQVMLSPELQSVFVKTQWDMTAELDFEFITKVLNGVDLKYGEEWCRCMFRDYTRHLIAIGYKEEQFRDLETKTLHEEANDYRVKLFLKSRQHERYARIRRAQLRVSPLRAMHGMIAGHVRSLQVKRAIEHDDMVGLFKDLLRYVQTKQELMEFLAMLPESEGGLAPVATHLFHQHPQVRLITVQLLKRLDDLKEGTRSVNSLNYFLLLTYHRLARTLKDDQQLQENVFTPRPPSPTRLPPLPPPVRSGSGLYDEDDDEDDSDDDDDAEEEHSQSSPALSGSSGSPVKTVRSVPVPAPVRAHSVGSDAPEISVTVPPMPEMSVTAAGGVEESTADQITMIEETALDLSSTEAAPEEDETGADGDGGASSTAGDSVAETASSIPDEVKKPEREHRKSGEPSYMAATAAATRKMVVPRPTSTRRVSGGKPTDDEADKKIKPKTPRAAGAHVTPAAAKRELTSAKLKAKPKTLGAPVKKPAHKD